MKFIKAEINYIKTLFLHHLIMVIGPDRMIKWIIENGADVNVRNKFNNTPLLQALAQGDCNYSKYVEFIV